MLLLRAGCKMFVNGSRLTLSAETGKEGFVASAISGKDLRVSGTKICFFPKYRKLSFFS